MKQTCWNPCWNPLLKTRPRWNPLLEPCSNPLSALEPLLEPLLETRLSALQPPLEPTFVRFWSVLEMQHSVWPFTTYACFGLRTLIETGVVTLRHCHRVRIVVLVVPNRGGGGVLRTPSSGAPRWASWFCMDGGDEQAFCRSLDISANLNH